MRRMCKIKDLPKHTNGIITPYSGRKLFLEGKIPGCRIGGDNSPILIDLDGLEEWLQKMAQANVKAEEEAQGKVRQLRIYA